jgi:hypothetical protein
VDVGAGLGRLRKRAGRGAVAYFPKENDFSFLFRTNSPENPHFEPQKLSFKK